MLSAPLQLQLLALLSYSPTAAPLIRAAAEPELFAAVACREVAQRIYAYLDQFHTPPGEHLPEVLAELLAPASREAPLVAEVLGRLQALRAQPLNEAYLLGRLERWIRAQRLKAAVVQATEALQADDPDTAETALNGALRAGNPAQLFAPGLRLTEGVARIAELASRKDCVPLGIKELDTHLLGPAPGELHLFIAPPKRGKTWWQVHIGKHALIHRRNVVYISLEISEPLVAQRFVQSLFSVRRADAPVAVTRIHSDSLGRLVRLEKDTIRARPTFKGHQAEALRAVSTKLAQFHARDRLVIKAFPTGTLTMAALRAYLEALERAWSFVPQVLIVDYPDLMRIDTRNYRLDLGVLFKDLRGLAVERQLACVVATQSNRSGAQARLLTDVHTSEDYSKIFTADTVITYSQTLPEKELGLARLFVSNTRVGEADRFAVLISQAYAIGQFCLDSARMTDKYEQHVQTLIGRPLGEDLPLEGEEENGGNDAQPR